MSADTATKDEEYTTTEMWRDVRKDQQARRAARLPKRTEEIVNLSVFGYVVTKLTDYQFRVALVGGTVDLYPTHRRYHNLANGKRGQYETALGCVIKQIGKVAHER